MKAWTIAWKDVLIRLRDHNALILTLIAPLIITAIMGAALGNSRNPAHAPLKDVPLAVVNDDDGRLGANLVGALSARQPSGMFKPSVTNNLAEARERLENGATQAVVYIPKNYSRSIEAVAIVGDARKTDQTQNGRVEIYVRSGAEQSVKEAARNVVEQSVALVSAAAINGVTAINGESSAITLNTVSAPTDPAGTDNPFTFFAPSLAIFFLMITMFEAPRSILAEKEEGTLGRLMSTPTSPSQILLGKLGGSYLTGILQFTVLVIASRLIFGLKWGNSIPGLMLMVISVVVAAASLGAVIAAFSKDVIQAGALGGGIALISAGLGGNFANVEGLPAWLQVLSRMTINRWALEGFSYLTVSGLGLRAILPNAGVLFGFAFVLFILAFWKFQQRVTG